jgi:hypothetical protein
VNHRVIQVETLLEVMEDISPKLKALGIVEVGDEMTYFADSEEVRNV